MAVGAGLHLAFGRLTLTSDRKKRFFMDSFIFALGAVSPIIITVAVGYVLKRIGFMSERFSLSANKLVFRVFLPCMLFLGVYRIEDIGSLNLGFVIYALAAEAAVILISIPVVIAACKERGRRGVLIQAAFRSNYALIGIPLAHSLAGDAGMAAASLLSVFFVPAINVCSVIVLSVYGNAEKRPSAKKILSDIAKNPLIISVLTGVLALLVRALLTKNGIAFRLSDIAPVYSVIENLSAMATPMALLVLGARFEFSAVTQLRHEIILGTFMRTVLAPMVGIGAAYLFFRESLTGAHFAAFACAFATPVAVASVPMSQEMGGDARLAGQLVVWTTLVSAFTLFIISFLLRSAGVFV